MAAACFGLQWCGVINTRPTRTPIQSLPPMNIRPNLNFNYNLNNYNVPPPLNLRIYTDPPPKSTRRPGGGRTRRPREEVPVPPPTTVERAPNANARPRE